MFIKNQRKICTPEKIWVRRENCRYSLFWRHDPDPVFLICWIRKRTKIPDPQPPAEMRVLQTIRFNTSRDLKGLLASYLKYTKAVVTNRDKTSFSTCPISINKESLFITIIINLAPHQQRRGYRIAPEFWWDRRIGERRPTRPLFW